MTLDSLKKKFTCNGASAITKETDSCFILLRVLVGRLGDGEGFQLHRVSVLVLKVLRTAYLVFSTE